VLLAWFLRNNDRMTGEVEKSRVAPTGHPFFIAAAVRVAAITLALLAFSVTHAAANSGYRLAGIVAVGTDYLGFLELPDGGQILVRKGSVISGGGRIVALDGGGLRIAFADRTIQLDLEGSGGPRVASTTRGVQRDLSDEEPMVMHEVSPAALAQLTKLPNRSGKGGDPGVAVAQRFASLGRLPDNARVLAINEEPVKSADAAIRRVEKSLAEGSAVGLKVTAAGNDAEQRVYLMPVDQ
jgi:hypothetical protein